MSKTPATKVAAANTTNSGAGALATSNVATPTIMTPTVGRRVHFHPNAEHAEALGVFDGQQPCDAGVLYVWGDRCVNLEVTGPSGTKMALQSVQLLQDGDDHVEGESYAAWMPYQAKKAAEEAASA